MFRSYPGGPRAEDDYDPRRRPWYTIAANGPKDVVLVVDTSGSMGENNRLGLTKDALKALIDSLAPTDRLGLVEFDASAQIFTPGTSSGFLEMTSAGKEQASAAIDGLRASGSTNFRAGLQTALEYFKRARDGGTSTYCESVIVFITDGRDTAIEDGQITKREMIEEVRGYYDALGTDYPQPNLFTLSMGDDADNAMPAMFACAFDGVWASVSDGQDPLSQLASFFAFFALSLTNEDRVVWADLYEDASGAGLVTTASQAVFREAGGALMGVVGVDVMLGSLKDVATQEQIESAIQARSQQCMGKLDGVECELQLAFHTVQFTHALLRARLNSALNLLLRRHVFERAQHHVHAHHAHERAAGFAEDGLRGGGDQAGAACVLVQVGPHDAILVGEREGEEGEERGELGERVLPVGHAGPHAVEGTRKHRGHRVVRVVAHREREQVGLRVVGAEGVVVAADLFDHLPLGDLPILDRGVATVGDEYDHGLAVGGCAPVARPLEVLEGRLEAGTEIGRAAGTQAVDGCARLLLAGGRHLEESGGRAGREDLGRRVKLDQAEPVGRCEGVDEGLESVLGEAQPVVLPHGARGVDHQHHVLRAVGGDGVPRPPPRVVVVLRPWAARVAAEHTLVRAKVLPGEPIAVRLKLRLERGVEALGGADLPL